MGPDTLTSLILEYRYWILVPLAVLEGPLVAFLAGTLSATGYFNIPFLWAVFIARDIVVDTAYWWLGGAALRHARVRRLLARIGVHGGHLEKTRGLWEAFPLRTMVVSKLSYGLAPSFFVVAGAARFSLVRFVAYNAAVAAVLYAVCIMCGYFYGNSFGADIVALFRNLQYFLAAFVAAYALIYLLRRRASPEGRTAVKPPVVRRNPPSGLPHSADS